MNEKQAVLSQHADCLEQLLGILCEGGQAFNLNDVCPYTELVKITPLDDNLLGMTPGDSSDWNSEENFSNISSFKEVN